MRTRFVLLCAAALSLAGLGQTEGKGKSKAKSKGREEATPPIAMPEPSALFQSLLYLGGVLSAGWLVRRKRKSKAIHQP